MNYTECLAQLPFKPTKEQVERLERYNVFYDDDESDELEELFDQIKAGNYDHIIWEPARVYTQMVDPETGDSVFHIVIRRGSIDGFAKILAPFIRSRGPFYRWVRHALFVHRNKAGNNSLHEAAKTGILDMLIMVYRAIDDDWSWAIPTDHEIENAPEKAVYRVTTEDNSSSAQLLMLLTKNAAGRTPADEARAAGHDRLALLLDSIVERLDPKGTRRTETGMAQMLDMVRAVYRYDLVEQETVME